MDGHTSMYKHTNKFSIKRRSKSDILGVPVPDPDKMNSTRVSLIVSPIIICIVYE